MKQSFWNLLKLAIGLGLLFYLYTRLEDPARLWQQIVEANKWLLLAGALCYSAAVALGGYKWGILLKATGIQVRMGRLITYQWVAEFFNSFLPAQVGGDVMRGYALASDTHRTADVAASVLIDRFIGLTVFMAAAAVGSVAMLFWGRPDGVAFTPEQRVSVQVIAVGSLLASLLLFSMLIAILSRRLKVLVERVLTSVPFLRVALPIWTKLAEAFNVYRYEYRALLLTSMCSIVIVLLTSINIWLIAQAIEPNSISLLEVLTINPIIVFVGLALPLSPGGLGVRQSAFAATFLLMGAGAGLGLAVGLVQQFMSYVVSLPGGYWWVRGVRGALPQSSNMDKMTFLTETYLTDDEARSLYTAGDAAHDFDHVWRVTRLAIRIAHHEGAEVTVVRLAALLHDVPVADHEAEATANRRAHHLVAADFARKLLMGRGMGTEQVANVVHCIEAHRFRDQSVQPQSIEAKCLYDADKLDSIGAIGVARAFAFAGATNERLWHEPWTAVPPDNAKPSGQNYTPVHEYVYKLRRILPTLHTESARRIGGERHRTMIAFFAQLDAEMQGSG